MLNKAVVNDAVNDAVNGAVHEGSIWVVTDLDGTLLDHHYCWDAAKPTLAWLKQVGIVVIPCTSKTAEEVERFRIDANLDGPFIVENGGAIHEESALKLGSRA